MGDQVETYSGHRLHVRPQRFYWEGAWRLVAQVAAQWRTPQVLHFLVQDENQQWFHLEYQDHVDVWQVRPARPQPSR